MEKLYQDYAEQFKLIPHIKFKSTVKLLDFAPDGPGPNGERFLIVFQQEGRVEQVVVDRVVVATGLNSLPNIPEIKGIGNLKGDVLHSQGFRS